MKKQIFKLYFTLVLLVMSLVACNKDAIVPDNLLNRAEQVEPLSLIKNSDLNVTKKNIILLHYAVAITELVEKPEFSNLAQRLFRSEGQEKGLPIDIAISQDMAIKTAFNLALRNSILNSKSYPFSVSKEDDELIQNEGTDINALLLAKMKELNPRIEPSISLFKPLSACETTENPIVVLGIDINADKKAIAWNSNTLILMSQEEAEKNSKPCILINEAEKVNPISNRTAYDYVKDYNSQLWYHHMKVDWTWASPNSEVHVQWITKYRWYSGWLNKHSDVLSEFGSHQSSLEWGNYRMCARVSSYKKNFDVYERHWPTDEWSRLD
jgi:hypothetical protein